MENLSVDPSSSLGLTVVILVGLAGLITNAGRRMRNQKISFIQYFSTDAWYSIVSILISVAALLVFYINKESSLFAYFGVGYIADSFINKARASE